MRLRKESISFIPDLILTEKELVVKTSFFFLYCGVWSSFEILEGVKEVKTMKHCGGSSGAIYGMGFLGALVYFLQHATSFQTTLLGIFEAIFWPGVVLYRVLEILKF